MWFQKIYFYIYCTTMTSAQESKGLYSWCGSDCVKKNADMHHWFKFKSWQTCQIPQQYMGLSRIFWMTLSLWPQPNTGGSGKTVIFFYALGAGPGVCGHHRSDIRLWVCAGQDPTQVHAAHEPRVQARHLRGCGQVRKRSGKFWTKDPDLDPALQNCGATFNFVQKIAYEVFAHQPTNNWIFAPIFNRISFFILI